MKTRAPQFDHISNVAQIFEPLLDHLFFRPVEFGGVIFDYFL
jgi:hypothetical protein